MTAKKAKPEVVEGEVEAVEDEVLAEYVDIPFRGHTFVVPRSRDDWSTEGLAYLGEGAYHLFIKYNLELARPGQWEQLVQLAPTRRDRNEFFEVHNKIVREECVD